MDRDVHTMEYCSSTKIEIMSFAGRLMELDIVMLSEISQI
jgi:hypothetical protein